MPRDGRPNRNKILAAAKQEFIAKGFEGASIRAIAAEAGVTSAALYRHFENKEALFNALVEPGLAAMNSWAAAHEQHAFSNIACSRSAGAIDQSEIDMIREAVLPHRDCFKLLLCCAQGTQHEHFVHDIVELQQQSMQRALSQLRNMGCPAAEISDSTLHLLLSAYVTALFEPIVHDYPQEDIEQYLLTMQRFFLPGWQDILGIKGP